MTSKEAERGLLEIIGSVETGQITPEEAVIEFQCLKEYAAKSTNLKFKTEYVLADFQKIRTDKLSDYQPDEESFGYLED